MCEMKFIAPYYKVRRLCHALKEYNRRAVIVSADLFSKIITKNDVVVPMPSHFGYSTYMLSVAEMLQKKIGCKCMDILSSDAHETWYDTKLKQGRNAELGYSFKVNNSNKITGKIYIIDNVYSTGRTMETAISKLREMYPNNQVDGIVIGYVDSETVKRLHYNDNLHESINEDKIPNNKYAKYCAKNASQLEPLIVSFLKNTEEGEKYYQPFVRSHGSDANGKNYLRFERGYSDDKSAKYKILTQKSIQLIDFNYIAGLLKLFMFINDKFTASFEYSNDGKLEYVVRLLDKLERDKNNEVIISHGHPISKKGQQVFRYGKVKSPVGIYRPHNYNKLSTTKSKYGNVWNKYFNPEYYVYNAQGQVIGFDRSTQTGNGQIPVHWFPKNDENARINLPLLARLIASAFRQFNNKHSEALFIAFLKCVNSGAINGFDMIKNRKVRELIMYCENKIDSDRTEKNKETNSVYAYTKPQKKYHTYDNIHFVDDDGRSSDEDMEYQINHLNLESIIRKTIKNYLNENIL